MGRRRAVSLLAALLAAAPLVAHAEPASHAEALPVALEFSGCDSLDQREALKLLAIEFQTLNVEARTPRERVRIRCGPNVARITIDERPSSNEVQLAATSQSAWPRLLALSVSELVIESRAQVAMPEPRLRLPTPPARATNESRAKSRDIRVFAGFSPMFAHRSSTWLAGPMLGVEWDGTRHLSLLAEGRLGFGSTDTDLAEVRWMSMRAALSALIGMGTRASRVAIGPGFSLGYLRLSPTVKPLAATAHEVSGAWGGPQLIERTEFDFAKRYFLRISAEVGIVVLPVRGQVNGERRLVDAGGVWTAASIALGASF